VRDFVMMKYCNMFFAGTSAEQGVQQEEMKKSGVLEKFG
jgi:hypothetical protein